MTIRRALQHLFAASMAVLLVACATTVSRGHLKEDESLNEIKIGTTTKDEVAKLMGSPSTQSSFGPLTWCYVSSIHQNRSILPTRITDQHVIEITFDPAGVVSGIKQHTLADSKEVEVASETTPTEGQKLGFFEQILQNLGRFNNNSSDTSNSHTHGNGGVPSTSGGYPGGR